MLVPSCYRLLRKLCLDRFIKRERDRQREKRKRERQAGRQAGRQTETETDTDRETERQGDRETERQRQTLVALVASAFNGKRWWCSGRCSSRAPLDGRGALADERVLWSLAVLPRARGSSCVRTTYAFALSILSHISQRERGIWCASGNFYALDLSEGLELEPSGLVRLAFLHYNTMQEVDHVLQVRVAAS